MANEPLSPSGLDNGRQEEDRLMDKELDLFEVTVWNITNGDIEEKMWEATWEEVEEMLDKYQDEPTCDVEFVAFSERPL